MGAVETVPLEDHDQIIGHVRELTQGTFCDRVIEAVEQWPLDLAAELTPSGAGLSWRDTTRMDRAMSTCSFGTGAVST